jgi:hypothetical protein
LKKSVLFVCIHNSARSQMAEAFLNQIASDRFQAESAGALLNCHVERSETSLTISNLLARGNSQRFFAVCAAQNDNDVGGAYDLTSSPRARKAAPSAARSFLAMGYGIIGRLPIRRALPGRRNGVWPRLVWSATKFGNVSCAGVKAVPNPISGPCRLRHPYDGRDLVPSRSRR